MPTGQVIVNDVLTKLGIIDPSGQPGTSDSQYVLNELNAMWDRWSVDEGLIYAILAEQYELTAYQQSYGFGPGSGADWSTGTNPVPSRIYRASVVSALTFTATTQTSKTILVGATAGLYVGMRIMGAGIIPNTTILAISVNTSITVSYAATASASDITLVATGLNRNPLNIVDEARYLSHNDLGAAATTPDEIYPRFSKDGVGNIRCYVFPVVNENQPSYIEIEAPAPFVAWVLTTNYFIPPGYQDAIEWAVAFRCLSGFGQAVQSDTAQVVSAEGQKAEQTIREMNSKNRQMPPQAVLNPAVQLMPQQPQQSGGK